MWALRNRLFRRLINQEIGFFDRVRTGELMNRLSEVCNAERFQTGLVLPTDGYGWNNLLRETEI